MTDDNQIDASALMAELQELREQVSDLTAKRDGVKRKTAKGDNSFTDPFGLERDKTGQRKGLVKAGDAADRREAHDEARAVKPQPIEEGFWRARFDKITAGLLGIYTEDEVERMRDAYAKSAGGVKPPVARYGDGVIRNPRGEPTSAEPEDQQVAAVQRKTKRRR